MDVLTGFSKLGSVSNRFRVIASNGDGLWNGSEASLAFEIRPMLWQTRWFQAAASVMGLAVAVGLYRLRLRQLAHPLNVRFEKRLAERTRIAQDLHDTLLPGVVRA